MKEKILDKISAFCSECSSRECCPEDECVLYNIEQIALNKKKKFKVLITEELRREIEVEAETIAEARDIVTKQYEDGKIVLNADDFSEYNIYVLLRSDNLEK